MAQPLAETQLALVTAFRADAGVQAAMTGASAPTWNIFDNVPVLTVFPYVYVADMQGRFGSASALNKQKATDIMLTLHIFSQYSGFKEVESIVSAIDNLIDEKPLTLTNGFNNFFLLFDNYIQKVDPDGLTRHGALRYRLMNQG